MAKGKYFVPSKKKNVRITPYLIEDRREFVDSFGQRLVNVHSREECVFPNRCIIHNPSHHHMMTWPLYWRQDRSIFERICPHGIGHPDPDDDYFHKLYLEDTYMSIHGCDGCCSSREVAA